MFTALGFPYQKDGLLFQENNILWSTKLPKKLMVIKFTCEAQRLVNQDQGKKKK